LLMTGSSDRRCLNRRTKKIKMKVKCCSHLKHLEHLTGDEIVRYGAYNEAAAKVDGIWVCIDCFENAAENSFFSHYIADDSMSKEVWG